MPGQAARVTPHHLPPCCGSSFQLPDGNYLLRRCTLNTTTDEKVLKSEPVRLPTYTGPCGPRQPEVITVVDFDARLTLRSDTISSQPINSRRTPHLAVRQHLQSTHQHSAHASPCGQAASPADLFAHLRGTPHLAVGSISGRHCRQIIDARTTLRWAASPLDTIVNLRAPILAVRCMSGRQPWPVRQACRDRQLDGSCQQPWGLLATTRVVRSTLHCPE